MNKASSIPFIVTVLIFCSIVSSTPLQETTTVFTNDGSLFKGQMLSVDNSFLRFQTKYGTVNIPTSEIEFVEGTGENEGLASRRDVVQIRKNGDIIATRPIFIKNRAKVRKTGKYTFLADGEVTKITDENGTELKFTLEHGSGYTRCSISLRENPLPGKPAIIFVETLRRNQIIPKGDIWQFPNEYIPDKAMFYTLILTLPQEAAQINLNPEATERISKNNRSTFVWRKKLNRQQLFSCLVEFQLR